MNGIAEVANLDPMNYLIRSSKKRAFFPVPQT